MPRPTAFELDQAYHAQNNYKAFGHLVAAICKHKGSVDAALGSLRRSGRFSPENVKAFESIIEKASIAATTTGNSAALAADPSALERAFLSFIRPKEVIGRLDARRIPTRTPIIMGATGATAAWRGQGKAIRLSRGTYSRSMLDLLNCVGITVVTDEVAKADDDITAQLITKDLANAVRLATDSQFLDWTSAGVSGESPAGIGYGATILQNENSLQDDLNMPFEAAAGEDWSSLALVMSPRMAIFLAQGFDLSDLGADGGRIWGVKVVTSSASPIDTVTAGTLESIHAIVQDELIITEGDSVMIDTSQNAGLEMDNSPSMDGITPTESNVVSLFQINATAVRANRWINWRMRVPGAGVAVLTDINPL